MVIRERIDLDTMPPPPPPAPPPPPLISPPPPPSGQNAKSHPPLVRSDDRSALLSAIRQGTKLKTTVTNDRSAPLVNGKSPNPPNPSGANKQSSSSNCHSSTPMGFGDLFAHGMPKLRSANQSFLQGGTYKSQLNPRPSASSEKVLKTPNLTLSKQKGNSRSTDSTEEMTAKNFNHTSVSTSSYGNRKPAFQNESHAVAAAPPPPPPPPMIQKPNFQYATISKHNAVQNVLQKNDFSLGGSEPNLSIDCSRPRSSSKPNPPPKLLQASSASSSPVKFNPELKYRSFEDTDVPKKTEVKRIFENTGNFTMGHKIPNNRSEPSNLNKITQNGSAQYPIAPARHHNRRERPVKPTTAPPPLPTRTTVESNVSQSSNWQPSHMARDPPPAPPSMPPPPPPPRIFQSDSSLVNGRPLPPARVNMPTRCENSQRTIGESDFESRFKFHKMSELPKPDPFSNKKKIYFSHYASQRPQNKRRARQPPPQAPPPPPPIQAK